MARDLIVRIIGDDKSLHTALLRDQKAIGTFGKTTTTSLGKVDSAFTKTQRIAAGGFIGGAAVAAGVATIRKLVSVSQESEESLGQTRIALEATGKSWEDYGATIERAVNSQSKLGFDDEALLRTFSLFVRSSGDVGKALQENNIAMDVARARFIDLEQAAQIVNKAALGQAGALRRLGIDTKGATDGTELLTLLQKQFGGAAEDASKRSTAAMDRLNVSLENIEETLGGALLPAIAGVADGLADAADDADALAQQLGKLGRVKIPEIHIPLVADFGGGTIGGAVGKFGGEALKTAVKVQFLGIGGTIASAAIDAFSQGVDEQTRTSTPALANAFANSVNTMFKSALSAAPIKAPDLTPAVEFDKLPGVHVDFASAIIGPIDKAMALAKNKVAAAIEAGNKALSKAAAEKARQSQRDAFDALIGSIGLGVDQAAATAAFADDLQRNQQLQDAIRKQIGVEGKTTELASQLFEAQQARAAILTQQAEQAAAAKRKAAEAIRAANQKDQFRSLGLSETGDEIVPGIENLAKRIKGALGKIDSGDLDVGSKLAARLRAAQKLIRREGGKLTEDTRRAIDSFIKAANGNDTKEKLKGPLTKTSSLNANEVLKGLGLNRDLEKELRARLSGFNSAGVGLAGATRPTGSFVGVKPPDNVIHVTVDLDGQTVAKNTTRHQQKTARRNPKSKRGPRSGV